MLRFLKRNAALILGAAAIGWMLTRPKPKTVPATVGTANVGTDDDFTATQINPDGSSVQLD